MGQIKAIETVYNGYRFRSRLEARWAVFFDAAGIKYEYEPEGFDLSGGVKYLPDFYLPSVERWIEIKGSPLTDSEMEKVEMFCEALDEEGVKFNIFIGSPEVETFGSCGVAGIKGFSYEWKSSNTKHISSNDHVLVDGPLFPEYVQFFNPNLTQNDIGTRFFPSIWVPKDKKARTIINAAIKARQARFEHGETP